MYSWISSKVHFTLLEKEADSSCGADTFIGEEMEGAKGIGAVGGDGLAPATAAELYWLPQ